MPLPDKLSREEILGAISDFEQGRVDHPFEDSEKFDLLADDGRRLPSKAIAALAIRRRIGKLLTTFTGGADSKCVRILREAGFQVVPKPGLIPFKIGSKYSRKKIGNYVGTTDDTTKGDWGTGYHLHQDRRAGIEGWWFVLANVGDAGRTGHDYRNYWISNTLLNWEGKTNSRIGQPQVDSLLSSEYPVLLFTRTNNRDDFTFHGLAKPARVKDAAPVRIEWKLVSSESKAPTLTDDDASSDDPGYTLSAEDQRERVLREIRARRGQQRFRADLMEAFNGRCAISGCDVAGVLEAAHIRPYRGPDDNHPANGLLLRSDIHTLFDLNLIRIEPENLVVHVHSSVRRSAYDCFDGMKLPPTPPLSKEAVLWRWQQFLATSP